MPHVIVKLWPGKSEQQKRRLAAAITKDVATVLNYGDESVSVALEEVTASRMGREGVSPGHRGESSDALQEARIRNVDRRRRRGRRRNRIMRGAVLYGPRDVRIDERPDPRIIEPTDAVIRLSATCICGSDLWPYRGLNAASEPAPMGHEDLRHR